MTLETILAGAREIHGPRLEVEQRQYCGVTYTVWRGATTWFAECEGAGFAVGADRESVIELVEIGIEDGDAGVLDDE